MLHTANNTGNVDFLRPDADTTLQLLMGVGGSYPSDIGALTPKKTVKGLAILIF